MCCTEVLERSVVQECWRRMLEQMVVEKCWRRVLEEKRCGEVLEKRVGGEAS